MQMGETQGQDDRNIAIAEARAELQLDRSLITCIRLLAWGGILSPTDAAGNAQHTIAPQQHAQQTTAHTHRCIGRSSLWRASFSLSGDRAACSLCVFALSVPVLSPSRAIMLLLPLVLLIFCCSRTIMLQLPLVLLIFCWIAR